MELTSTQRDRLPEIKRPSDLCPGDLVVITETLRWSAHSTGRTAHDPDPIDIVNIDMLVLYRGLEHWDGTYYYDISVPSTMMPDAHRFEGMTHTLIDLNDGALIRFEDGRDDGCDGLPDWFFVSILKDGQYITRMRTRDSVTLRLASREIP